MCSELFRIPIELHGMPLFGMGILLAIWVIVGIAVGIYLLRSNRPASELAGYLPGWLLGGAVFLLVPRLFPEGLPIRGYGVMVLLGSIAAMAMVLYRARQVGLNPDVIISMAFGVFISGIAGARLFFVIEYWDARFDKGNWKATLIEVFKFTEGGLVFYGSIIGGTLAFVLLARKNKLPVLAFADIVAPSLMIGLAFGRIGCLLNGCCYGGQTDHPWGVTFPRDSIPYFEQLGQGSAFGIQIGSSVTQQDQPAILSVESGSAAELAGMEPGAQLRKINDRDASDMQVVQEELFESSGREQPLRLTLASGESFELDGSLSPRSRPLHPTQLYSSINAALLAWLLWSFYPFRKRDGQVIGLLLAIYPISRFLLEIIRIDESAVFGTGLSISQNISLFLLAGAVLLWGWLKFSPTDTPLQSFAESA